MSETAVPLVGGRVAHYEIVSLLGAGGMGAVYLARDTRLHRQVALKLLRGDENASIHARRRFLREARAVAALEHPNICTLYEVGSDGGVEYLAMQYVEGETLAAAMKRGRMPVAEALRTATQLTSALAYAHAKGVLHRDVKPQNVMVQRDGSVTLLDFGLAKMQVDDDAARLAETEAELTRAGTVMGTAIYMAPEQLSGAAVDERSDVYSLGLVLSEMAGREDPGLNGIVAKATARRPADRYASAAALLAALTSLGAGAGMAARPARTNGRFGWLGAAIGLLVAIAAGIAWQARRPVTPTGAASRSVIYWLDVRGTADSPDGGVPRRTLGDDEIPAGSKVRVNVVSPTPGFLYLLSEEGDSGTGPIALVYPVGTEPLKPTSGDATGWYGFAGASGVDRVWIVWSDVQMAELDALRPFVNDKDLGQIRDAAQAVAIRRLLATSLDAGGRETRDTKPLQASVSYDGGRIVRRVALHHAGGGTS